MTDKSALRKLSEVVRQRHEGTGRGNRIGNDSAWPYSSTSCEGGNDHTWQPVQLVLETGGFQPDLNEGKCFVVCMVCHSWSYILTEFVGFYIADPDTQRMELRSER